MINSQIRQKLLDNASEQNTLQCSVLGQHQIFSHPEAIKIHVDLVRMKSDP